MKVLLLSMPDSFEHTPADAIRMPNAALTSLAGNVDRHHRIAVADLILVQSRVRETVTRLVAEQAPDVVGLSIMTFQRKTAKAIIRLVRSLQPSAHIVVGGYDPALRSIRPHERCSRLSHNRGAVQPITAARERSSSLTTTSRSTSGASQRCARRLS